jgi:hypothetical protein
VKRSGDLVAATSPLWFCGDVHGCFGHVLETLEKQPLADRPLALIFLGDLEPQEPLTRIFQRYLNIGIEPWFIHGNHDSTHADVWKNTLNCWERNLHGRVETVAAGIRIAGLGGTFRHDIWFPDHADFAHPEPRFRTYDEYIKQRQPNAGWARQHSATIFPDVVQELSRQRADVLVTHEGPSCHPEGFATIDRLAKAMGVKKLFHGHHHQDMSYGDKLGFEAFQVGLRGIRELSGAIIKIGDSE